MRNSATHQFSKVLIFILIVFLVACGFDSKKQQAQAEAEKEAKLFWSKSFSQCGDSLYGIFAPRGKVPTQSPIIVQIKNAKIITFASSDIESAEKYYGFRGSEFTGATAITYLLESRIFKDGHWSNFGTLEKPFSRIDSPIESWLRKIDGRWEFGLKDDSDKFVALPCDQIPEG